MIRELQQSELLKGQYKLEQSEGLNKINRISIWILTALVAYLAFVTDKSNFPDLYIAMRPGRLVAIGTGIVVGVLSFLPWMKKYGVYLSLAIFLSAAFMMAYLTGVMNNHSSDIIAWVFVNVIFCGIYPLPLLYSAAVVLIADAVYVIVYFSSGFAPDFAFQLVLININSASLVTLALKIGIERIRKREFYFRTGLQKANEEIATLNNQLTDQNLRLSHELQVAQHIQSIVLPRKLEYREFADLDIACQMIPAAEVGGDYYDTISFEKGGIISIGDVTNHGLHSGLIMMMVHTALRALSNIEQDNIRRIYQVINKLLYDFRLKTEDHRIMSLILIRYIGDGQFVLTGQHESLLIFRKDGTVEDLSSLEYGMYAGLEEDVDRYLDVLPFTLERDDVLVLYTDGVTEAVNTQEEFFGNQGIVDAVKPALGSGAEALKDIVIKSCRDHIGTQKYYDDISVMVLKKR